MGEIDNASPPRAALHIYLLYSLTHLHMLHSKDGDLLLLVLQPVQYYYLGRESDPSELLAILLGCKAKQSQTR